MQSVRRLLLRYLSENIQGSLEVLGIAPAHPALRRLVERPSFARVLAEMKPYAAKLMG